MSMTNKQIYTKVSKHLLKQGKRSEDGTGVAGNNCVYRSSDGLMCAVGCLIPDDQYYSGLEGQDVNKGMVLDTLRGVIGTRWYTKACKIDLLEKLQFIHDQVAVDRWAIQLKKLKEDYKF
tara:strand:+ start:44 stop:403 length:360 start_codon:yes stop_codon:yes gene_type:complete